MIPRYCVGLHSIKVPNAMVCLSLTQISTWVPPYLSGNKSYLLIIHDPIQRRKASYYFRVVV
jgi:hypothetical protein